MVNIPLFTKLYTSQVVQEFFHQQYCHVFYLVSSNFTANQKVNLFREIMKKYCQKQLERVKVFTASPVGIIKHVESQSSNSKVRCNHWICANSQTSWWFQSIWKILVKMGSSSPIFGVKIPKIFELPPPSKGISGFSQMAKRFHHFWIIKSWKNSRGGTVTLTMKDLGISVSMSSCGCLRRCLIW